MKIIFNKPFLLYRLCIPVLGSRRSLLHDIQRSKLYHIPNDLHNILTEFEGKTINNIISSFGKQSKDIIHEYFEFLIKNDLIFFCEKEEIKLFPHIQLEWDPPSFITNAIIEYNREYDIKTPLSQLHELGCFNIQFVFGEKMKISDVDLILEQTIRSGFKSFSIYIQDNDYNNILLKRFVKRHLRIRELILFNSPKIDQIMGGLKGEGNILFRRNIPNFHKAYEIPFDNFIVKMPFFCESQNYNTYYNRKIAISNNGDIKNCITNTLSFGNIKKDTIKSILDNSEIKNLWYIKKDKTQPCKNCEYRYVCLDGRIPIKKNNQWGYSTECNYNPYNSKWNYESK